MLLSTVSVLVVAQSSSEIPEGLMNNPVLYKPVTVAVQSKVWVCGLSIAGVTGSNPAGVIDVCFL